MFKRYVNETLFFSIATVTYLYILTQYFNQFDAKEKLNCGNVKPKCLHAKKIYIVKFNKRLWQINDKRDGSPALWGDARVFMYVMGLLEAVASLVWQHREDLDNVKNTMKCFIVVAKQKLLSYKFWNSLNNDLIPNGIFN